MIIKSFVPGFYQIRDNSGVLISKTHRTVNDGLEPDLQPLLDEHGFESVITSKPVKKPILSDFYSFDNYQGAEWHVHFEGKSINFKPEAMTFHTDQILFSKPTTVLGAPMHFTLFPLFEYGIQVADGSGGSKTIDYIKGDFGETLHVEGAQLVPVGAGSGGNGRLSNDSFWVAFPPSVPAADQFMQRDGVEDMITRVLTAHGLIT